MSAQKDGVAVPDPGLASTDELVSAMAALPDPLFVMKAVRGPDGTVVELKHAFLNEAAARFYDLSVEAVLGHGQCELFPSAKELGIWDTYLEVIESGSPVSFEVPLFQENGVEGSFRVTTSRLGDGLLISASDISEQMRAERALAEANRQYRLLAENASDFVVQASLDGVITWVSPSLSRVLGWAPEDLLGTRLDDLVHPDDVVATGSLGEELDPGQEDTTPGGGSVVRIRTKAGEYRWMSAVVAAMRDASGVDVAVASGLRDVDDLVKAREAAQADRTALRATADSLLDPHVRFGAVRDESGQIVDFLFVDANPAACAYNGMDYEDLIGRRLLELLPGHVGAGLLDRYAQVVETGEPLVLDDFVYAQEVMGGQERRYDIRAARVGDGLSCTWRDVTDRYVAGQRLAESEERYRLLAENASDVVFMAGPDLRVVWMAPTVKAVLGWESEELVGTRMADLLRPGNEAVTGQERSDFHSGHDAGPDGGYLFEMRTKSGEYRWLSGHGRALTAPDGAPLGVVSGLRDVTDVMRARQDAETDRATLRATVDSLLDPHVLLEAVRDEKGQMVDFVYVDANPAACAYDGMDYHDLVGTRLLDLMPGTVGAGFMDRYRQVVETGQPLMLDDVVYAQEIMGGQERHYDVRAARVGDGMSYTWRDVTDRHAAARRLAESEEHYRLLAENASDVVMRLSPDLRCEWVSGSVAGVLGWQRTYLVDHVIDEFIYPDDLPGFRQAVADADPESVASVEFRFRHSDGTYGWLTCRTRVQAGEDGTPVAVVGGLVDISQRKAAEAAEQSRLAELEQFQRLTVGRELKMVELKKEIEHLRKFGPQGGSDPADEH